MLFNKSKTRLEKDSMGELEVTKNALYGAQTQRAINNFPISDLKMPRAFINALGLIKGAAAVVNDKLGLLETKMATAIQQAADEVAASKHDSQFPVDVFQTGSGTSTNMNANEVIANLAQKQAKINIHPNDHVNLGQSSNDVIPTAIHLSCSLEVNNSLLPALEQLVITIEKRAQELENVTKTGRTHLMDAMPITFGQELSGWANQIHHNIQRIKSTQPRIQALALGGTAVGTGINAHPDFATQVCQELSHTTGIVFRTQENYFAALSCQDAIVELSGQLRCIAVSMLKIANDLRLMNSGPLTGMGDISLPALQPGSSIMPGKVNPVIPEAICMLCAQVMGNDTTIAIGGQAGNFQLNTMLPVIAYNALQSISLITNGAKVLAENCIANFTVNQDNINDKLTKNPILVTALNPVIGYEQGAAIAKRAYEEKRSVREIAQEMTNLSAAELDRLLDPQKLTKGGITS